MLGTSAINQARVRAVSSIYSSSEQYYTVVTASNDTANSTLLVIAGRNSNTTALYITVDRLETTEVRLKEPMTKYAAASSEGKIENRQNNLKQVLEGTQNPGSQAHAGPCPVQTY